MMAIPVVTNIAAPKPCKTRMKMSTLMDVEKTASSEDTVYNMTPRLKTFLRPYMSATLPKGTKNTAMASRKAVATQLKITASAENSVWMAGRATLTEEIVNGPIKDVRVATNRADFSCELSADTSY